MLKKPLQRIVFVFWLLSFGDLLAIALSNDWIHSIVKPLLMPALGLVLFNSPGRRDSKKLIAAGLLFSWLGDVFLLFESHRLIFFILGLASFLITHICYIIHFLAIRSQAPSLLKKQPLYILLIIGYGAGLVLLLYNDLGPLKIPVIMYATVICSMLLCSIHIYSKVNFPGNLYYVTGALLFVMSDSILAVNKFYHSITLAGVWLMLSYCAAQFFIIKGFAESGLSKERRRPLPNIPV
ncbi:MAG: hypothetical protein JWP81_2069 [Ferruginibacter sp.]|nr:hypothetical protein [Ferruginibacter sp.]